MSVRADSQTLQQIPLFRDCDAVPLQILAFTADRQDFATGEEILSSGKKARAAYLILSGRARMRDDDRDLGYADPGALLGELAMMQAGSSFITATATGPVETARISHELFIRVAQEYPDFGKAVLHNLNGRLETYMRELEGVRVMLNKSRNFADLR